MDEDKPNVPSLGESLLDLADHLRQTFTAAVAHEGLTFMEGRVLRVALRCQERNEIVAATRLAGPSVSEILAKLERLGLIARTAARGDRRQRIVQVTPDGLAALRRIFERLNVESPLMTALDLEERLQLKALVSKVLDAPATPDVAPPPTASHPR